MDAPPATFRAVVLAGERPGGSALSRAAGVEAGVLVPVAGIAAVERVLDALDASYSAICHPVEVAVIER